MALLQIPAGEYGGVRHLRRRGRLDLQRDPPDAPPARQDRRPQAARVSHQPLPRPVQGYTVPPDDVRRVRAPNGQDGRERRGADRRRAEREVFSAQQALLRRYDDLRRRDRA